LRGTDIKTLMLFKDLLDKKFRLLKPDFDRLINDAGAKQTHPFDLLLVRENGVYDYNPPTYEGIGKLRPFQLGRNIEGISFQTHHEFMGRFIEEHINKEKTFEEYKKEVEWSKERSQEIDSLRDEESYSIQKEMLLYLKIWESDTFIKKLFQFAQLIQGKDYDWHFKIDDNEKTGDKIVTGKREIIIRKKVRNKLEKGYPHLYAALKNAYISQLRNAIAHSQYSLFGSHIQLNNYKQGSNGSPFPAFSFEEWTEKFHDSLVIYSHLGRLDTMIGDYYELIAENNDGMGEVRVKRMKNTEDKPELIPEYYPIQYDPERKMWRWYTLESEAEKAK
jgi:hypothetical protein